MGKVKDIFVPPDPPDPPKLPAPTLMEDTEQVEAARRRKIAANQARAGRASTDLTGSNRNRTTLGGS